MMKLHSRLCLLGFIAICSFASVQVESVVTPGPAPVEPPIMDSDVSPTDPLLGDGRESLNETANETGTTEEPSDRLSTVSMEETTGTPAAANFTDLSDLIDFNVTKDGRDFLHEDPEATNGSAASMTPTSVSPTSSEGRGSVSDGVPVSIATTTTTTQAVPVQGSSASWGYVILVMIILSVVALCVILFFLRRHSRRYSFDLHRPGPFSHNGPEHTGTFEPVYLDDLDRPVPSDHVTSDDLSPPPVANGTSLPSEEKSSAGENAPNGQVGGDGPETPPPCDLSLSLDIDLTDKKSDQSGSSSSFFDAVCQEQQNGNNNNPTGGSSLPFVEISLDEPVWCDHLLTSPGPASSVLPFSPFSLSSSP
ncbi:uncharacterized protein LOC115376414 isoform X2 [Myripristis murdjan]|uniref:uncharacterized protein LOC115376414 isoform X2 n=1 Tax=Myripristis murdjan TaxID=586833 RepID=UPI001175E568|nr:uncharacterized protein LOC115376414 isoform X2 [Myripristis murdjan]